MLVRECSSLLLTTICFSLSWKRTKHSFVVARSSPLRSSNEILDVIVSSSHSWLGPGLLRSPRVASESHLFSRLYVIPTMTGRGGSIPPSSLGRSQSVRLALRHPPVQCCPWMDPGERHAPALFPSPRWDKGCSPLAEAMDPILNPCVLSTARRAPPAKNKNDRPGR